MAFGNIVKAMTTLESHIRLAHKPRMETIGARIREAREKLGLTQQQLAERLGVDQSTVSGWERDDKRRPGRDLMPIVAKALGRTVDWLEGREAAGLADRARSWDAPAVKPEPAADPLDEHLLAEVINMAMRNMLKTYGVDIPESKFDAAAETAAAAYQSYFRLRRAS